MDKENILNPDGFRGLGQGQCYQLRKRKIQSPDKALWSG